MTIGDDLAIVRWRSEYLYSLATTDYGRTAEIEPYVIARRRIDLGHNR
jgi:hypothetical protein